MLDPLNMTKRIRPLRSRGNLARMGASLVGLGAASLLVVQGSQAAFTDTTDNNGNSLASGSVILNDDDGGATAMFNVSGLNGGQTITRCINVAYTGSLTADIKMYTSQPGGVGGTGLAPGLDLDIEVGTGATGGTSFSCANFTPGSQVFGTTPATLANFASSHTNYTNGVGGWNSATNPSSRSYRVTMTVSNDDTYQNKTATVGFTWEAQGQNG